MEPFKLNNGQIDITKNLFGKIFWRTEKEYVQEQVAYKRKTTIAYWLRMISFFFFDSSDAATKANGGHSSFGVYTGRKIFLQSEIGALV